MNAMIVIVLLAAAYFIVAHTIIAIRKSRAEISVCIGAASGDSETMEFRTTFDREEDEESKASKLCEIYQKIQDRKDENHAKWLAIKAKAIEENQKLSPEELKKKVSDAHALIN